MRIYTLKQLYTAIIQPHFDYGDMVYGSASTICMGLTKADCRNSRPEMVDIQLALPLKLAEYHV